MKGDASQTSGLLGNRFVWTETPLTTFTRYLAVRYGFGRARLLFVQEDNKWSPEPTKHTDWSTP